ncbi:hypothetical protein DBR44_00045 [Aquitalea sp. FJL05]|nr:hypothetical protein DBR44_00045 [Aquitalea sp. FJL05]
MLLQPAKKSNTIAAVQIENLWGIGSNININLDKKFNFLIGRNGSGKTTVINLIAAVLSANIEKLEKIEFDRITIHLRPDSGQKKPTITVRKNNSPLSLNGVIYEFKTSQRENPVQIAIELPQSDSLTKSRNFKVQLERYYRDSFGAVQRNLDSMIQLCWLPLHRYHEDNAPSGDRRGATPIDHKLNILNNNLVRYFSELQGKYSEEVIEFQKNILLSVLTHEKKMRSLHSQPRSMQMKKKIH